MNLEDYLQISTKKVKDEWIYESPDGGETVFRRPAGDYESKNKVEIDWETKEPTGRVFSDYNGGNWKDER